MNPRGRNPRLVVRGLLAAMKADLTLSLARWTVRKQVFVPAAERTHPSLWQRARHPWEWPEYRVEDWRVLDRELAQMAEQVTDARAYVAEQIRRLHCTCGRRLPISEVRAGYTTCEHCSRSGRPAGPHPKPEG